MNEAIQAIAEKKTKDQLMDEILIELNVKIKEGRKITIGDDEIKFIEDYIGLLRRQAQKAKNQRKTLRDLHKVYKATLMENRWLREVMTGENRFLALSGMMKKAKETLWRQFKKEQNEKTVDD